MCLDFYQVPVSSIYQFMSFIELSSIKYFLEFYSQTYYFFALLSSWHATSNTAVSHKERTFSMIRIKENGTLRSRSANLCQTTRSLLLGLRSQPDDRKGSQLISVNTDCVPYQAEVVATRWTRNENVYALPRIKISTNRNWYVNSQHRLSEHRTNLSKNKNLGL